MIPKTFQLDFIRAIVDYKLSFNDNETYFSNNELKNYSFYEHITTDTAANRYVQTIQDLTKQLNRTQYNGLGVFSINQTPSITNLYDAFISPFEFTYVIRCQLKDRDKMVDTLYHLIDELKGRKVDVAQLDTGVLFPVGTITEEVKVGDFVGEITLTTSIDDLLTALYSKGITIPTWENEDYLYAKEDGKLVRYYYNNGVWVEDTTYFIEELSHSSFTKYKVSLSFNDITVNTPYSLDAEEYVSFELGGSATLVNGSVQLGNDLVRVFIKKNKIITGDSQEFTFTNGYQEIEPLEIPSNSNANSIPNQLRSNFFQVNSHTDSLAYTLQYTFVCDFSIDIIKQWFLYARYHICNLGNDNSLTQDSMTPNIIYDIKEIWSSWGEVDVRNVLGKINEDIAIENTEADILTLGLSFQLQGENN